MNRYLLLLIVASAVLLPQYNVDAAKPVVRIKTDPASDEPVVVGQRVRLILDVLGQDGWANVPKLPTFDVPGAIVYVPEGQATRLNETIQGDAYTGQRNEWWIYPQRSGPIMIPRIDVEVKVKFFGAKTQTGSETIGTKPIKMKAAFPEGVSSSTGLVVTDQFQVKQTWEPSRTEVSVGDGVVRSIERKIGGAPALVLPDILFADVDGVTVYRKAPEFQESNNRSELTSARQDRVTYVFTEPGTVDLPSIQLTWWNLQKGELETEMLSGQMFLVTESAATEASPLNAPFRPINSSQFSNLQWWAFAVLLAATILIAGHRGRKYLRTACGLEKTPETGSLPPLNP
ncbi:BatD family protein [Rubripirellula reticaptiva]|uniref:Protein BatD n=1 Tax=Rubripirellula reticaptiva TaxID=2528013 RepID=A0A5C6F9D0_9BACT|nr:BatD family protein [Rubripirellula reticaptiva]TWU56309.1 hypothetical protein Poly59_26130 [Rubripirellula reticaptiva]